MPVCQGHSPDSRWTASRRCPISVQLPDLSSGNFGNTQFWKQLTPTKPLILNDLRNLGGKMWPRIQPDYADYPGENLYILNSIPSDGQRGTHNNPGSYITYIITIKLITLFPRLQISLCI